MSLVQMTYIKNHYAFEKVINLFLTVITHLGVLFISSFDEMVNNIRKLKIWNM